jgi:hypothetical protein
LNHDHDLVINFSIYLQSFLVTELEVPINVIITPYQKIVASFSPASYLYEKIRGVNKANHERNFLDYLCLQKFQHNLRCASGSIIVSARKECVLDDVLIVQKDHAPGMYT